MYVADEIEETEVKNQAQESFALLLNASPLVQSFFPTECTSEPNLAPPARPKRNVVSGLDDSNSPPHGLDSA
jgi:hypothetical protein